MRASTFFLSTKKEPPTDTEIVSHQLMMRTGMIRRLGAGIYTYMPLGLRTIRKIEAIVREEMNRAGAIELLMPVVQPAELWQETGRWQKYGPELARFKDRHDRDFVIQPTSEEIITDIARNELRSWRQLPMNFYHVQTKFRDERRPRFGVMRGREFTMKDAYSFDRDITGMQQSYQRMFDAYTRIFTRLGLAFRAVVADNGAMGGTNSHEFHVLASTGEDAIVICQDSTYAANLEAAEALPEIPPCSVAMQIMAKVATPGKMKCEAVAAFLKLPLTHMVKSIVLAVESPDKVNEKQVILLLLRGDHSLNEIKLGKIPGLAGYKLASEAETIRYFGTPPGYLGPVGTKIPVRIIADCTVAHMANFVCGANELDYHLTGVNWGRDVPAPETVADVRNVVEGDLSPDGKGILTIQRGIEVGHVFQLGTTYSQVMDATYLDNMGKRQYLQMGCYGIGISRIMGAAIEQNFDGKGILWPQAIAPFEIVLCPIHGDKNEAVRKQANELYDALCTIGIDVILDDRGERPGVMLAEWELIGIPHRVVIGERNLKEGHMEYQARSESHAVPVSIGKIISFLNEKMGKR